MNTTPGQSDSPPRRVHFFDLTPDTLAQWCDRHRWPSFRAGQLFEWVYRRGVTDPQQMTNLANADRQTLSREMAFERWAVAEHHTASDGTQKLLMSEVATDTTDIAHPTSPMRTECVMIPAESRDSGRARRTACISSQVGCPVGCRFCASGLGGLEANLTTGQIVEQVHQLNRVMSDAEIGMSDGIATSEMRHPTSHITNIVFMGMGEPLSNFANVVGAIHALAGDWGFGLSARRITLSTVGLPAQVRRLADQLDLPITLAISLHAPNDALREQIIPWAQRVSIEQLVDAGRYYFKQTGREVTLEYILLGGVNDRPVHAKELAKVAGRLRSNVNLIRYNEVAGLPYARPDDDDVHRFQQELKRAGVNAHIRASRGRDIAAACGQLRHEAQVRGAR